MRPRSISIPKKITDTLNEPTRVGSFEGQGMTGAEVFARACKEENLAALCCCPGNYPVIQAMAGIPAYGRRSEGSMTSAADGFSRVTGEVTACSGTEGPGFTNMIMNIVVAHWARTPLLVLSSNVQSMKEWPKLSAGQHHQSRAQRGSACPLSHPLGQS